MSAELDHELMRQLDALFIPTVYYLVVVSTALMVYEHLLTLDAERRVIWGSKRSIPTMLFLTNRYALWLFCLSSILWNLVRWHSAQMCYMAGILNILITILLVLVIALFLSVRIHAINGRRWFWTCLVFLLSSAAAPYDFASLVLARFQEFNGSGLPLVRGCFSKSADVLGHHQSWVRGAIAVQACSCMANVIAVVITWYRTKGIIFAGRMSGMKTGLASSLFQSGMIFFLVDLLLNVAQIYLFARLGASIATFLLTVESVLASRFILSLRTHESGPDEALELCTISDTSRDSDPHATMPVFDYMAGPLDFDHMAGPLDFWSDDEDGRT